MPRSSRLLAGCTAAVLVLTACADDGADLADRPPPSPTTQPDASPDEPTTRPDGTTPTPAPSPSPTSPVAGEVPELREFCLLEPDLEQIEHIEFAYPEGWQVAQDDCGTFDPVPERLPDEGDGTAAAVRVRVSEVPFARAAEAGPDPAEEIRFLGAVSGYQAVRVRIDPTGQGRPEGDEPLLTYLIDLDPGGDEEGGTLVATARPTDDADPDRVTEALDRMLRTVRIVPPATGSREPLVVARSEGGGTPFSVTYDGSCFRLLAGGPTGDTIDETCDVGPPGDGITGALLGDEVTRVVVGVAPEAAAFVVSDAASAPYGAFTVRVDGATVFAYDVVQEPIEVRAVDVAGEPIATGTVR